MIENIHQFRYKKKIFSIIIGIIAFSLIYSLTYFEFFQNFEKKTYDYRLRFRPDRDISDKVVIVFICKRTTKHLGWPLPREYYGILFQCFKEFGARTVGIDVHFGESNYDENDQILVEETEKAGNVFSPMYFYLSRDEFLRNSVRMEDPIPLNETENSGSVYFGSETGLHQAVNAELPFKKFQHACKGLGHVNVNPDPDGITRRVPALIEYDGYVYPSLSFAMAYDFLGIKPENISFNIGDEIIINQPGGRKFNIPINQKGEVLINYAGNIGKYENYSFLQILQAYKEYIDTNNPAFFPEIDLRNFKDKIVLIGLTALGSHDVHSTPFINKYALVGVHANMIDSILKNQYLSEAPWWLNTLLILLFPILAAYSIPRYSFRKSITLLAGVYLFFALSAISLFFYGGLSVYMFFPTIALFVSILLISMFLLRYEEIEKMNSERDKLSITKKLWEKEKQFHDTYDKLFEKENAIARLKEDLKKALDESTMIKSEYMDKIKTLEEEKGKLYKQQEEINQNKELLKSQLVVLETPKTEAKSKPKLKKDELKGDYEFIIGESQSLLETLQVIDRAAPTMANIMITGNTGTGKELLAKAVHVNSPRNKQPFVAVNCAAIPRDLIEGELFGFEKGAFTGAVSRHIGKFEQANNGTIFLDEIGDMSLDTQAKVLRAIQEKVITRIGGKDDIKIDTRIITATHKNLKEEIEKKSFRADLFFRLNVIPVILPTLSQRQEDIPKLIQFFLDRHRKENNIKDKIKITPQALQTLMVYNWPGNIRELENMVQRILTLKENDLEIRVEDIPSEITGESPNFVIADNLYDFQTLKEAVEEFERRFLVHKLNQLDWNKTKTAEVINLGRRNLHKKITKYEITEDKDRIREIEF